MAPMSSRCGHPEHRRKETSSGGWRAGDDLVAQVEAAQLSRRCATPFKLARLVFGCALRVAAFVANERRPPGSGVLPSLVPHDSRVPLGTRARRSSRSRSQGSRRRRRRGWSSSTFSTRSLWSRIGWHGDQRPSRCLRRCARRRRVALLRPPLLCLWNRSGLDYSANGGNPVAAFGTNVSLRQRVSGVVDPQPSQVLANTLSLSERYSGSYSGSSVGLEPFYDGAYAPLYALICCRGRLLGFSLGRPARAQLGAIHRS